MSTAAAGPETVAPASATKFERLHELVALTSPDRLASFDAYAHRLRTLDQDDEVLLFIEMAGFLALLTAQTPARIAEERGQSSRRSPRR